MMFWIGVVGWPLVALFIYDRLADHQLKHMAIMTAKSFNDVGRILMDYQEQISTLRARLAELQDQSPAALQRIDVNADR